MSPHSASEHVYSARDMLTHAAIIVAATTKVLQ